MLIRITENGDTSHGIVLAADETGAEVRWSTGWTTRHSWDELAGAVPGPGRYTVDPDEPHLRTRELHAGSHRHAAWTAGRVGVMFAEPPERFTTPDGRTGYRVGDGEGLTVVVWA